MHVLLGGKERFPGVALRSGFKAPHRQTLYLSKESNMPHVRELRSSSDRQFARQLELSLTVRQTPYGVRISGPDERAIYLQPANYAAGKAQPKALCIWQSASLEVLLLPANEGVEIRINARPGPVAEAPAAKAA